MNVSPYVGLPLGEPPVNDCYELLRFVYQKEFGIELPQGTLQDVQLESSYRDWMKVDEPVSGDAVMLSLPNTPFHCGVYIGAGQMLHATSTTKSHVVSLKAPLYKRRVLGFFRHRLSTYSPHPFTREDVPKSLSVSSPCLETRTPRSGVLIPRTGNGQSREGILNVHLRSAYIAELRRDGRVPIGSTIQGAFEALQIPETCYPMMRVELGGVVVPQEMWQHVRPKAGNALTVAVIPMGGGGKLFSNETLRLGLSVVSLLAGTVVPMALGLSGPAEWAVRFAITAIGIWATTTLIPPMEDIEEITVPTLTSVRNQIPRGKRVPKIYGRIRFYPPLAALPYTEVTNKDQYLRLLFLIGYKPLDVYDLKIGDKPLYEYEGVEVQVNDGWNDFTPITLYTRDVYEERIDRELLYTEKWQVPRKLENPNYTSLVDLDEYVLHENVVSVFTQQETEEVSLDLTFPEGLGVQDGDDFTGMNVDVHIRFRPVGSNGGDEWTNVVPYWNAEQFNIAFEQFKDTNIGEFLYTLIDKINEIVDALNLISLAERIVAEGLYLLVGRQVTEVRTALGGRITINPPADPTTYAAYMDGEIAVRDVAEQIESASVATYQISSNLASFNNKLSMLTKILDVLYSIVMLQGYIERGYGPEITQLSQFQRFMVGKWNLEYLFGSPPTGAFKIVNYNRERGSFFRNVRWGLPVAGQYEVQIRRTSESPDNPDVFDDCFVSVIRSISGIERNRPPIRQDILDNVALVALRIKASDQLSGTLPDFNCMVDSPLRHYEDGAWQPYALLDSDQNPVYDNPAWIYADVATGTGTNGPISLAKLDETILSTFAAYCRDGGYHFSFAYEEEVALLKVMEQVLRVAKAAPTFKDGLRSVLWDEPKESPVALISMRNSNDFSISKAFINPPDAINMRFVNPDKGWVVDEMYVYNDGFGDSRRPVTLKTLHTPDEGGWGFTINFTLRSFPMIYDRVLEVWLDDADYSMAPDGDDRTVITNESGVAWEVTSLRFEVTASVQPKPPVVVTQMDLEGLVDSPLPDSVWHTGQVFKLGRYFIAAAKLRPEVFQVNLDFEHLTFERGDRVDVEYDVTLWGLGSARLKAITNNGTHYTTITLDAKIIMESGGLYEVIVRNAVNEKQVINITTVVGAFPTVTLSPPLLMSSFDMAVGDLVIWGVRERSVAECIVKEIKPGPRDSAMVTLIQHSPDVHNSTFEQIPEFDSLITLPIEEDRLFPPPPVIIDVETDESVIQREQDGSLTSKIRLFYQMPRPNNKQEELLLKEVNAVQVQFRKIAGFSPLRVGRGIPEGGFDPLQPARGQILTAPRSTIQEDWTYLGVFAADSRSVDVVPVQDGEVYQVRIRSVTAAGSASEWTLLRYVYVIGKQTPPPLHGKTRCR